MSIDHAGPLERCDGPLTGAARAARFLRRSLAVAATAFLAACGGGGGGSDGGGANDKPATRAEAARFLTQASFGPTDASIDRVMSLGFSAWINEQFALPAHSHLASWDAADALIKQSNPSGAAGQREVIDSFWRAAVAGEDQLRQRVAFALSQIFVISMQANGVGDNPRAVAGYMDLLAQQGVGSGSTPANYRQLLEGVSRHPMMGVYLSHLRNQKENTRTGRVPDENYAREVMQLFSIGLYQLNLDGSPRMQGGERVETYASEDIAGLAKVFTGFSLDCPAFPDNNCFFNGVGSDAGAQPFSDRLLRPMRGYPQYHSTTEKRFLGTSIAAQNTGDPDGSLATALDALYRHPNVGPFIGKQLIQRLVTSNPSPAYVEAVARAFNDNGRGVRGDMQAVVRAVLLHPEARDMAAAAASDRFGKLREPVLRLSALMRAVPVVSDSGQFRVNTTDRVESELSQTPMRAPSVFNFWRPGYVAPGTSAGALDLAAPEMQITHESSVAGYVNYMRDVLQSGVGVFDATRARRDIQFDFSAELALADTPDALVTRLSDRLAWGSLSAGLRADIAQAVGKIVVPAPTSSNAAAVASARLNRVRAAVLLVMASPEFLVQQ
jgi:uncharacterized protein (DUF1800 family)